MKEFAKLIIDGKELTLPVIEGSEGEMAIDIRSLRQETGYITFDPGFGNTGTCKSTITYMNGEQGILRYRGIPIEQLAEHSSFVETAFLLIAGMLPTREELTRTSVYLNDFSLLHENMKGFYRNYPPKSHPMGILSAMINAMRSFYPELIDIDEDINNSNDEIQNTSPDTLETFMNVVSRDIIEGNGNNVSLQFEFIPLLNSQNNNTNDSSMDDNIR